MVTLLLIERCAISQTCHLTNYTHSPKHCPQSITFSPIRLESPLPHGADGVFIHRTDGKSTDATGAIVDFIRVASSSGFGSTHLIGHELGHNLMSIARDAGVITEAQQKELDALFTDKNGKFDEEAFAEAFARELKRAFFETVQKRMEDVPATKAGRALRRVADFIATLARSFAFWRQERGLDPVTGQPLQAGQVLDAFLKRERTAVDEATRIANAARAAEARATQEAMANAPTQTVVDEDGTEVAYHERGGRDVSAEDFARTFGIRFAMDGNARSQDTANVCYDTLLKLAKLMGVPQETLGIGGLLTLDIAVVEELLHPVFHPTNNTINLTIPNNINVPEIATAATIVHEWTHALDRIVGLGRDADPNVEITEETTGALSHGIGPQVREELLQAGKRMTEALRNTRFYERISNDEEIKELDREDPEAQLFDPQEVFARALANYYLANELGRIPMFDEGLGPTMEELSEVGPILREFFDALEVGVNETTGVQTLYHDPEGRTRYEWENWTREEKLERIRATNDIHIVTPIEGDEAELLAKYLEKAEGHKKDIVDWALNEQNRIVSAINTNAFIGNIKTSGNSIRSILSHGSGPLKVLVLRHLDEILTNAVPYRIGKGKKEGRTFINLAHRLSFDGREHIAYVSILEDRNGNRTYDVEFGSEERLLRELPNGPAARNESEADADSRNTNSIAQSDVDVNTDPNEERMNHISDGSGVSAEMNEWYLDAVFGNDMDAAKRMVMEAARRAGYDVEAFHDAGRFGFTVFNPRRMRNGDLRPEDERTIFLGNLAIASSYSGEVEPREIGKPVPKISLAKMMKSDASLLKEVWRVAKLVGADVKIKKWYERDFRDYSEIDFKEDIESEIMYAIVQKAWADSSPLQFWIKTPSLARNDLYSDGKRTEEDFKAYMDGQKADFTKWLNGFNAGTGTYALGVRMKNPLTIDAEGAQWLALPLPEGGRGNTHMLAKWALAHGYDGVVINNVRDQGEFDGSGPYNSPQTEYIVFDPEQVKSLDPVTYDDNGELIPLSDRFNPENVDIRWHESEGGGSVPRFTETPLGQELVAEAFDAIMGSRVDLLLRPSRYYGNPYETAKRNPKDQLVTEHLHRDSIDITEPKGFATEVSAEISRFGTREGDPTLRDIRARCGSKERFYEVLGAVYETAEAIRSGLSEVVTWRERTMMSNAGLLAADFIKHNATARATALGRKLYLMGREFAWKLYKEDIAAARAEAQAKVREANAKTREAKAQTRNAERREETARNQAYQNRWGLAEERFMREYERALLRHQAARKVSDVREKMQEQVDLLRLREARKRALERERGVTFKALKATLGVDIPARLRALAGTQEDPFEAAAKLIAEIDDGFDKWVKRDRRDLLDGTEPYTYLNEQGERAYAETMGNVLKAVARDLSYGKLREALVNAADKIARAKPETVRVIVEGKLGRVARVLRLAQNADIVTLANRRIKSALAEANKRLSSANSGMRTRYMTAMRKQAKELIKTMQLAVSAQDNTKASEKKRYAMLAERARLAEELKVIESGKTPDDLAKDETLTDRQHQDAVKLMFLEKFGDLSYTIDPAEVWAKAAEAEGFVVS